MIEKTGTTSLQWHHFMAMLIVAFVFFMSGLVSEEVFERLPHLEDELAYLYQARVFAGGNLVVESPQPANAYWQPFVVDSSETNNRFSKYTPGWSALLAIGVLFGYEQIINIFLSALTVALVYRLGREIFNPDVGLIAALLTAFSPMALLLNGTLMSHTSGLFFTTLFIYAYWRLEKGKHAHKWGMIAGISLGILASTRPLTTLGIGLPFIAWSGVRLFMAISNSSDDVPFISRILKILTPLLVLSVFTSLIVSSIPLYSYVATGDPQQNLYELVWNYDRIGFGEGHGRNRHRLEKALVHARFDLSLTRADLFGWQFEPVNEEMIEHLQVESDFYPGNGYSFYLLPFGLILGLFWVNKRDLLHRSGFFIIWTMIVFAWVWIPQNLHTDFFALGRIADIIGADPAIIGNEGFSWFWISTALLLLFLPLFFYQRYKETPQITYTWLLISIVGSVVIIQMLYWIGSQRYSTRYYYEALSAAALITAIPFAWIISKGKLQFEASLTIPRILSYCALLALCFFTLYNYSTPRISALYRFNGISPELIETVESARVDDRPILAIISGESSGENRVRWRSYASLMTVTSPYLNSEIVAVRDFGSSRQRFIETYPERQIVDVYASGNDATVQSIVPLE